MPLYSAGMVSDLKGKGVSMDGLDYWRLCDELSVAQSALLLVGIDPSSVEGSNCEKWTPHERPVGYEAAKTAISNALRRKAVAGRIVPLSKQDYTGHNWNNIDGTVDINESSVDVDSLRTWLVFRGLKDNFFLPEITETADYLDENHPRFSAKLAAAVRAWQAMEDENLRRGKSAMNAMAAWLEANYKSLGLSHKRTNEKNGYKAGEMNKTAIAEAAKISNWEVDGGTPSTPGS